MTTTTKTMGDLTAKDITMVRNAFVELVTLGKFDLHLDGIAEAVIARGDIITGEEEAKKTAPKKTAAKKTENRLPVAPVVTKTETTDASADSVVVGRNYTFGVAKLAGVVGKYLEPAKRAGAGRFTVVLSDSDEYPVGKVIVVKTSAAKVTRKGPRS